MSRKPMEPMRIGRYRVYKAIASGGMASVHFGTFAGPAGFSRTVAIKRMHPHLAKDPEFVAMFVDEARLAARIRHPNVVATLDVLSEADELSIVMEYAHGEPLAQLMRLNAAREKRMPAEVACAIAADVLAGLHAAHEATDDRGRPLGIVHRDVSPDNVLVGADGAARVFDFGVAKAVGRLQVTREGQVKGTISYMAPEQVRGGPVDRSADVYSMAVLLWEMLTGRRLFDGERDADILEKILFGAIDAPAAVAPHVPEQLNTIVLRGLARDPTERFPTARDMARSLHEATRLASTSEVADWVSALAGETLKRRADLLATVERESIASPTESPMPASPAFARPASARRRLRIGVLAAAATILGGFGLFAARATEPRVVKAQLQEPANGDNATAPTASVPVEAPPVVVPPPLAASPTPARAAALKATGAAQPSAKRSARPAPTPPQSDCDPPYTTDSDGTRHYKLKCL